MNSTALAIIQPDELNIKKFWSRVKVGNANECWEWQGALTDKGYGWLRVKRQRFLAHRISYQLEVGAIPERMLICHHCDNPPCVNPTHLFVGTHLDNALDMVSKNRHARYAHVGEANPIAKLTEDAVRQIRALREQGITCRAIAEQFGLCNQHVSDIVLRRVWKHVE